MDMKEDLSYEQALTRLESLQEQLENNEIGIDDLAKAMSEANNLLGHCKERLRKTEEELANLEGGKKEEG